MFYQSWLASFQSINCFIILTLLFYYFNITRAKIKRRSIDRRQPFLEDTIGLARLTTAEYSWNNNTARTSKMLRLRVNVTKGRRIVAYNHESRTIFRTINFSCRQEILDHPCNCFRRMKHNLIIISSSKMAIKFILDVRCFRSNFWRIATFNRTKYQKHWNKLRWFKFYNFNSNQHTCFLLASNILYLTLFHNFDWKYDNFHFILIRYIIIIIFVLF